MKGGFIGLNTVDAYTRAYGGGVYVGGSNTPFTMTGGSIEQNTASGGSSAYGGGVYVTGSSNPAFRMDNGDISNNTAWSGGGVYMSGSRLTMFDGIISGNNATNATGGGIYTDGVIQLGGGTIKENTAGSTGAGVYATGTDVFFMAGSILIDTGNEVKLAASRFITLYGNLTQNPAADINPSSTVVGATVLDTYNTGTWLTSNSPKNYMRFLINGVEDKIDAAGKIQ
jgi:hypothetical protein